jgi:14-3-3 protein epsilon
MAEAVEELIELCSLYHREQRDREALEGIGQLIELDPVFDKRRSNLFHAIYKMVIDSIRDVLSIISHCTEIEEQRNHTGHVALLQTKHEELCRKLISFSKEAVGLIDQYLLPNANDVQLQVFFLKLKGDLWRYIAEFSEENESISAGNSAESSYTVAFEVAVNLPACDPVKMSLHLNAAVFKYDIKKDIESASEMLERAIDEIDGGLARVSQEWQNELLEIQRIMRQNLEMWADE